MNSIQRVLSNQAKMPGEAPPIWFMRQAGRYHQHYQKLRAQYSFLELCRQPELAAEVAMGPIEDFDFDAAILFSDILFPLDAWGLGLHFSEAKGPQFERSLNSLEDIKNVPPVFDCLPKLEFQKKALQITRQRLHPDKGLLGFVGGPFTLFSYAVGGRHEGSFVGVKQKMAMLSPFLERLLPLIKENIRLQIEGGADCVMVFESSVGELDFINYDKEIAPFLEELARSFPKKLGFYARGAHPQYFNRLGFMSGQNTNWAGMGVDHRYPLSQLLKTKSPFFVQGNFDQNLLFLPTGEFRQYLKSWISEIYESCLGQAPANWICGLGHGVLPKTPESHVREFVLAVREFFGKGA